MDNTTLRKIQLTQLEIMKYLHEVCHRHGIPYSITNGSAIGAVRHGGFIPWDDDLDIMLLRPDYERLLAVLAAEPDQRYWLQSYDTDPDYWQPFAKVRRVGTVYKEAEMKHLPDDKCGVWVDIFPLDYVPSANAVSTRVRRWLSKTITFSLRCRTFHRPLSAFSRRYVPILCVYALFPKTWLKKWQNRLLRRKPMACACNFCDPYEPHKETFPATLFTDLALISYEDTEFYMVRDYDAYLTRLYGDYMTPPPEDKRGGHTTADTAIIV